MILWGIGIKFSNLICSQKFRSNCGETFTFDSNLTLLYGQLVVRFFLHKDLLLNDANNWNFDFFSSIADNFEFDSPCPDSWLSFAASISLWRITGKNIRKLLSLILQMPSNTFTTVSPCSRMWLILTCLIAMVVPVLSRFLYIIYHLSLSF